MELINSANLSAGNQIFYTKIRDCRMVSLLIDNIERVCLSQISNTLLSTYSYNEIHNRRVALGITCIQCTPIQLDILRSTGAMPVSSRRCGMITKKEAERLVNSFLDENKPLNLPENFSFEIEHKCGFGNKGTFYPSRYNSSRAKCIRCLFCGSFFTPNKFIFHMHENSGNLYNRPETSNFNSWRRYIFLTNHSKLSEEVLNAWEDVKSIFNGGKRKRTRYHSTISSESESEQDAPNCEPLSKQHVRTDSIDTKIQRIQPVEKITTQFDILPYYNFVGQFYYSLFPNLFGLNLSNIESENFKNSQQNLTINHSAEILTTPKPKFSFNFKNIRDNLNESSSFEKETV